jgi:ATP-dependent Clp protease ATP-binding subunit ClpB
MLKEKEIKIDVSDEAKDWLAQLGYDVNYGARPLKRVIQKYLVNPLSHELLAGNFGAGDTVIVGVGERVGLVFNK